MEITSDLKMGDSSLIITIKGDITSVTVGRLISYVTTLFDRMDVISSHWNFLILDMTSSQVLDSAGLNFIISLLKRVQARSGKMIVKISNLNIHRTFLFTRMEKQFEIEFITKN